MKKFAAVFPGQGSQSVGMFQDFLENEIVSKTFDEANEALGFDLKTIILSGPDTELNKTEITQPAILTASVAAYRALAARGYTPSALAGHSLGEYSALVAAGAIEFKDAVRLVHLRGQAMQEAVPQGVGAMAAVLGLDDQVIIDTCASVSTDDNKVWAANFNTPGQVVISGNKEACDRACAKFTELGAKRVVPLAVSAPSHCPLMQAAADRLEKALNEISISDAKIPVYVNVLAKPLVNANEIKDALVKQLTMPVRWVETVVELKNNGIEALVECGPNKVLSGLVRRIDKTLGCSNVCNEATLDKTLEALA